MRPGADAGRRCPASRTSTRKSEASSMGYRCLIIFVPNGILDGKTFTSDDPPATHRPPHPDSPPSTTGPTTPDDRRDWIRCHPGHRASARPVRRGSGSRRHRDQQRPARCRRPRREPIPVDPGTGSGVPRDPLRGRIVAFLRRRARGRCQRDAVRGQGGDHRTAMTAAPLPNSPGTAGMTVSFGAVDIRWRSAGYGRAPFRR